LILQFHKKNVVFEVVRKLGGPIQNNIEIELTRQGFDSFHALAGLADENYFKEFVKEAKEHMKTSFNLGSIITIKSVATLIK
jgi:hypothetical protein